MPPPLHREGAHRRIGARHAAIGCAARGLGVSGAVLGGKRDADVMQHRILHRYLEMVALAGFLAAIQRAEDGDRQQHAGAGVAERWAGFQRTAIAFAGDAHRAAAGLRDHVERQVLLVRAALAEALDLAVDDRWVDLADHISNRDQAVRSRRARNSPPSHRPCLARSLTRARPFGSFRLMVIDFLLALNNRKYGSSTPGLPPSARPGSPLWDSPA